MSNVTLKLKRGAGAPQNLQAGEPAYDTENKILRIGDGTNIVKLAGEGAVVMLEGNQSVTGVKTFSSTISGSVDGNAATATALATGRDISLTGDVTGTASAFNGSANASISATLANSGVSAGTYTKVTVDAKGRATAGTTLEASDIPSITAAKVSDFDTQVRTSRLDQMAVPTADVSLNSQKITNLATPTADSDAATKAYVDATKQGLDVKDSVRVATTANITLSGTQTIDGIAVIAGDRVLVKNQTTGSANGIYVVAAGAWSRSTDADTTAKVTAGMFTFVEQGTANADSGWVLTTDEPTTLGTTALTFTQFSGAGQITAGAGLTKTGNTLDVGTASTARIVVNADSIDLATAGTAGTYRSVTTDAYGRVTAGTNPTTLAGYGITDAQPLDATLTALAGVTTAANQLIYATGADAFATTDLSSYGRSLIDDADAAAARTTLGLSTMATQAANDVNISGGSISGVTLDGGSY